MLGGVGRQRERGPCELFSQLAVGKAVQHMFAAHQELEERAVRARHRVERAHGAVGHWESPVRKEEKKRRGSWDAKIGKPLKTLPPPYNAGSVVINGPSYALQAQPAPSGARNASARKRAMAVVRARKG